MRGKSGESLNQIEFYNTALKFLENEILEAELDSFFIQQNSKHHFEIALLKNNYSDYSKYVRRLNVKNRRNILFDYYSTGLTRAEIENIGVLLSKNLGFDQEKYISLGEKKLSKFIKMQNKDPDGGSVRFLELMALIARVPIHWLIEEKVSDYWESDHLLYLYGSDFSLEELYRYFNKINRYTRDVRGIKLKLDSLVYRMRVEVIFGAVLIEILHKSLNEEEYRSLFHALEKIKVIPGTFQTVIQDRIHYGFFSEFRAREIICIPIEFQSFSANWQ